jgi:hypothetical protein
VELLDAEERLGWLAPPQKENGMTEETSREEKRPGTAAIVPRVDLALLLVLSPLGVLATAVKVDGLLWEVEAGDA